VSSRPEVAAAGRVVVKLGTRTLTHEDGRLALARLFAIVEAAADLARAGREILVVSSGAVGLGREALGFSEPPVELADRQACAAVGQTRLMGLYREGFSRLGLACGQVLLTQGDFDDRVRYLNLRSTLEALLRRGVIPVINENDAVSTEELAFVEGAERPVFGDNDRLSALVATKLGANLLLLLTDVDGVYDRPPGDPEAKLLSRVDPSDDLGDTIAGPGSKDSRGGMRSKVESARIAARGGCHAVIAAGGAADVVARVVAGEDVGTWFPPGERLESRRQWIAYATAARGTLHLDEGAVRALVDRGASLLAVGVHRVEGDFEQGDVVELRGPDGTLVGRGMVHCDAEAARAWCGGSPPSGIRNHHALVHRDHIVLEG
jgi:glutamate 5-kinase